MLAVSLLLVLLGQAAELTSPPQLVIEGPAELGAVKTRLESFDTRRMADIVRLVGLRTPGGPIRIELATESSDWASAVPSWVAGLAMDQSNTVVIFPSRSPSYPDDSLDDVVRHEVAHILISRAASGRPVPRWFNEGLAMSVEHGWRFGDRTQLFYQLVSGSRETLDMLDRLFQGTRNDSTRAYLLSGAFVRQLLSNYGENAGARILEKVARGVSFEAAFSDVTGRSPTVADAEFWDSQRVWTTWIPIVFSQEVLWMGVTVLALLAIRAIRRRNARLQKQWEEEEKDEME